MHIVLSDLNNQQDWTRASSQILKLSPSYNIEHGENDSLKKEIESLWNLEIKDPFIVSDSVGMFYYAVCLLVCKDGLWQQSHVITTFQKVGAHQEILESLILVHLLMLNKVWQFVGVVRMLSYKL